MGGDSCRGWLLERIEAASGGRTLHKLRHSRLTQLAEAGENVTLIKALSRHRSLRSLERYVNPSNEAVAGPAGRHDPNRRRRAPATRRVSADGVVAPHSPGTRTHCPPPS